MSESRTSRPNATPAEWQAALDEALAAGKMETAPAVLAQTPQPKPSFPAPLNRRLTDLTQVGKGLGTSSSNPWRASDFLATNERVFSLAGDGQPNEFLADMQWSESNRQSLSPRAPMTPPPAPESEAKGPAEGSSAATRHRSIIEASLPRPTSFPSWG